MITKFIFAILMFFNIHTVDVPTQDNAPRSKPPKKETRAKTIIDDYVIGG